MTKKPTPLSGEFLQGLSDEESSKLLQERAEQVVRVLKANFPVDAGQIMVLAKLGLDVLCILCRTHGSAQNTGEAIEIAARYIAETSDIEVCCAAGTDADEVKTRVEQERLLREGTRDGRTH